MRCYLCNEAGRATEAVALCPHCSIGLCAEHRTDLATASPGGTGLGCGHPLPPPPARVEGRAVSA